MSFMLNTPCYNCKKDPSNGGTCTDGQTLQEGVNDLHSKETHQGGGDIAMCCVNMESTDQ